MTTAIDVEGRILAEETAPNAWWPLDAIFAATYWNRVDAGSNEASWRSGYAEDCKSLHPGSIPGEASNTRAPARSAPEPDVLIEMNRGSGAASGLVGT